MLKFIANLFGAKHKAPEAPAPYKVETPTKATPVKTAKPNKKPTAKAKTARKPRAPKAG